MWKTEPKHEEAAAQFATATAKSRRRRRVWGVAILVGSLLVGIGMLHFIVREIDSKLRTVDELNAKIDRLGRDEEDRLSKIRELSNREDELSKEVEKQRQVIDALKEQSAGWDAQKRKLITETGKQRQLIERLGADEKASRNKLAELQQQTNNQNEVIGALDKEERALRTAVAEQRRAYEDLRKSVEQLYAVRVTPRNEVYAVRATANPVPPPKGEDDYHRWYDFTLYINSPEDTLQTIRRVTYSFNHITFPQKKFVSEDRASGFAHSHIGWGCLGRVDVVVELEDGTKAMLNKSSASL